MMTRAHKGHLQPKELDVKVEKCTSQLSIRSSLDVRRYMQVGKSGIEISSRIELIRSSSALCGVLRTPVGWQCQSRMD